MLFALGVRAVGSYQGQWIERTGDETLSAFPRIHLGDLVVRDGEVSGGGVNIASRREALAT